MQQSYTKLSIYDNIAIDVNNISVLFMLVFRTLRYRYDFCLSVIIFTQALQYSQKGLNDKNGDHRSSAEWLHAVIKNNRCV